eukprot:5283995-Pleurochrysis_carterae.AAC.1
MAPMCYQSNAGMHATLEGSARSDSRGREARERRHGPRACVRRSDRNIKTKQVIPTVDANQHAQIKSHHRRAGIKSRKYIKHEREFEPRLWNCTTPDYNVK